MSDKQSQTTINRHRAQGMMKRLVIIIMALTILSLILANFRWGF